MLRTAVSWFVVAVFVAVPGCKKPSTSESSVKFDGTIRDSLNPMDLMGTAMRRICDVRPIFIFVGNAEEPAVTLKGDPVETFLPHEIELSSRELRKSLGSMLSTCLNRDTLKGPEDYRALFVSIIDGPSHGDSKIESNWYVFDTGQAAQGVAGLDKYGNPYSTAWKTKDTAAWRIDDQGQVGKADGNAFELHLPTHLEGVVKFFLAQKPPKMPDFDFDQTIYIIKSHGGRFFADKSEPNVENVYAAVNTPASSLMATHAFLFDPHGPSEELMVSQLYTASFDTPNGCKRFAQLKGVPAASPEVCRACAATLRGTKELGAFAACKGVQVAEDKSKTLSMDENSTMSMDENSTMSMDENSTMSMDENSTMSMDENSTMSMDENSTMGAGKSRFFQRRPNLADFDHVKQVAQGVVYSGDASADGLTRISLPLRGREYNGPLIVLDSCWGTEKIAGETFRMAFSTVNKEFAQVPVTVVINPNPIGFAAIRYGTLDYWRYLALPYIYQSAYGLAKGGLEAATAQKIKDQIDTHLQTTGLSSQHDKEDYKKAFALADAAPVVATKPIDTKRQLMIYVLKDGLSYGGPIK